jgi:hypothetical protein
VTIVETLHFPASHQERETWALRLVPFAGGWRWLIDWPTADAYHRDPSVCPE